MIGGTLANLMSASAWLGVLLRLKALFSPSCPGVSLVTSGGDVLVLFRAGIDGCFNLGAQTASLGSCVFEQRAHL